MAVYRTTFSVDARNNGTVHFSHVEDVSGLLFPLCKERAEAKRV